MESRISQNVSWCEELGFFFLLFILAKKLAGYNIQVRYDENQTSLKIINFLALLRKFFKKTPFVPALLSFGTDETKASFWEYSNNITLALNDFCNSEITEKPTWYTSMMKSYLYSYLWKRFAFVTMVEKQIKNMPDYHHEIIITGDCLNHIVLTYFKNKGLNIRQNPSLLPYIKLVLAPLYLIMRTLLQQPFYKKVRGKFNKSLNTPAVWIEYESQDPLWKGLRKQLSKMHDHHYYEIVYYLDRPDSVVNKSLIDYIEGLDLGWIDIHNLRNAFLTSRDVTEIFLQFIKPKKMSVSWLKYFEMRYDILHRLYRSLFKRFNVKVLIQHQEENWVQQVQANAIESAGGIMLGFHWSNYINHQNPGFLNAQHVFFVWGKLYYEFLEKKGHNCKYILPSGIWIADKEFCEKQNFDFSSDVSYIICIFDNTVCYNSYFTEDALSQFFLNILIEIESKSEYGGIIKSKNYSLQEFSKLPDGEKIEIKIKELLHRKKLIILDSNKYSLFTAAKFANIGYGFGINSACIIAALYGYKTISWEYPKWNNFPIVKDPEQKVIYPDLSMINDNIERSSKGDVTVGDLGKWKQILNYFNDFNGTERIILFIRDFMKKVSQTNNMNESLDFAVKEYIKRNRVSEDYFVPTGLWN